MYMQKTRFSLPYCGVATCFPAALLWSPLHPGRHRRLGLLRLCVPCRPSLRRGWNDHRGALPHVQPGALGTHVCAGTLKDRRVNEWV